MINLGLVIFSLLLMALVMLLRLNFLREESRSRVEQGLIDPLTGVGNRRRLDEQLPRALAHAQQHPQQPLALILIDIDHLSSYNQRFGHNSGDEVMIQVAHLLKNNVRGDDAVCRWANDRFLIIAPNISLTSARQLAETLRARIEKLKIHGLPGQTASIGFTLHRGDDNVETLIRRADVARHHAKNGGRNRVEFRE